jgi:hypothetical protein
MPWKASHLRQMQAEIRNQTYNVSFKHLPRCRQKVFGGSLAMGRFRAFCLVNIGKAAFFATEPDATH